MPHLLTLSRAARLAGISRGALQKKIQQGVLPTFEGKVRSADLLRVYPDIHLEDDAEFERVKRIKAKAFGKRVRERIFPDAEVLAARLKKASLESAQMKVELSRYQLLFERLLEELDREQNVMAGHAGGFTSHLKNWLTAQIREAESSGDNTVRVIAKDNLLRVMAAHVKILPSEHEFFVEGNDSILDAALHSGLALNYGCSNGACGLCKARILSGKIQKIRHHDFMIKNAEKRAGYALLCCHTAVTDLVVETLETANASEIPHQHIDARVKNIKYLSNGIALLNLKTPRANRLRFLAGQSATLSTAGGQDADYAIASCPCDDRNVEFHINREPENSFSEIVFSKLANNDIVTIDGPSGDFVLDEESARSLVFIAWGPGFAPIKSLVEHALALDVADTIHLCWIVSKQSELYLDNLCRSWSDALDRFQYVPIINNSDVETALDKVLASVKDISTCDVYMAGSGAETTKTVESLTKKGLPREHLFIGPSEL